MSRGDGRVLSRIGYVLAALVVVAIALACLAWTALEPPALPVPPRGVAVSLLVAGVVLAIVLWRGLVKLHARLQAALRETLDKPGRGDSA